MDYEKANQKLDEVVLTAETKVVDTFKGNMRFIGNLRKYITNEYEYFETVVLKQAISIGSIFIMAEVIMGFIGFKSILGIIPKVLAVALLFLYLNLNEMRRKK